MKPKRTLKGTLIQRTTQGVWDTRLPTDPAQAVLSYFTFKATAIKAPNYSEFEKLALFGVLNTCGFRQRDRTDIILR